MTRRFGTLGHTMMIAGGMRGMDGLAVASLPAMATNGKPRRPRILNQAELADRDRRTERQKWNDEVEARRVAKMAAKGKQENHAAAECGCGKLERLARGEG